MAKQYLDLTGLTKYDELIKAFIRDPNETGYITTDTDQDITGIKTFTDYLKTDQIDSEEGKGLVRYKSTEVKSVFGNDSSGVMLMGNTDRPYYSNSGSNFTGVELALKSDVDAKGTGSVTSVATGDGLTGGPITTTGTIKHATPSGASTTSSGFYKVATDQFGHVTGTTAVTKADITGLGIPGSDTNTAHTHTAGTGLSVTGSGGISGGVTYSLKTATSSTIGGVKSSTTGTTSGRDYNVQVNTDGTMKVNVPWTDTNTTYTLVNGEGTDTSKLQLKDNSGNIASSIVVNYATNANNASTANKATTATTADSATKATNDGDGNKISSTYLNIKKGGSISGDLTINGGLTVTGTETINQIQYLDVVDQIISTNTNGATLTGLSGLAIVTGESDADSKMPAYGIVYDSTEDTVKLGLGKKRVATSGEQGTYVFEFDANEGEPIAIRADSDALSDDHLLMWDSDTFKIVDSGHTYSEITTAINNVSSKLENYVTVAGTQNVTGIKTFTSGLKCSVTPTANNEVLRYQDIDSISTSSIEALF